jgi:hypothetical protein
MALRQLLYMFASSSIQEARVDRLVDVLASHQTSAGLALVGRSTDVDHWCIPRKDRKVQEAAVQPSRMAVGQVASHSDRA